MLLRGPRSSTSPDVIDSPPDGELRNRGMQDCGVYVDGVREPGPCGHAEGLLRVRALGRGFIWLHLHEPLVDQLQSVADALDLHHLDVEDAMNTDQRAKVERYDDSLVLTLRTLAYVDRDLVVRTRDRLAAGQLTVFAGPDFVLSVGYGAHTGVAEARQRIDNSPDRRATRPDVVLFAIADHVVGGYLRAARRLETDIDAIEHDVFSPATPTDIEFIYLVRREIIQMRRLISPLTTALRRLAEDQDAVSAELRPYLRDVMQHNVDVTDRLHTYGESMASLLESAYGRESTQQNVDLRKISSWAALAAIPTTVSGIYGMRFVEIPEEHWAGSYPTVLAAMALTTVVLHRAFRRRGWL